MERTVDEKYQAGRTGSQDGTKGILKAAIDVQIIWHGSIPWEKPEEPPAPSVLEKRLSNDIE